MMFHSIAMEYLCFPVWRSVVSNKDGSNQWHYIVCMCV